MFTSSFQAVSSAHMHVSQLDLPSVCTADQLHHQHSTHRHHLPVTWKAIVKQ